jgi:osmoprotectant transport system permease protein
VGLGGLGFGIIQGLALRNFAQVTVSAVVIIVITITGEQFIGLWQRLAKARLVAPQRLEKP